MKKKDLIDAILEALPKQGASKTASRLQVESVLEAFCSVAAAELLGGGEITLQGIGRLKVVPTKARKGHDPKTGEVLEIPDGRKVAFSPFRDFREALKP